MAERGRAGARAERALSAFSLIADCARAGMQGVIPRTLPTRRSKREHYDNGMVGGDEDKAPLGNLCGGDEESEFEPEIEGEEGQARRECPSRSGSRLCSRCDRDAQRRHDAVCLGVSKWKGTGTGWGAHGTRLTGTSWRIRRPTSRRPPAACARSRTPSWEELPHRSASVAIVVQNASSRGGKSAAQGRDRCKAARTQGLRATAYERSSTPRRSTRRSCRQRMLCALQATWGTWTWSASAPCCGARPTAGRGGRGGGAAAASGRGSSSTPAP